MFEIAFLLMTDYFKFSSKFTICAKKWNKGVSIGSDTGDSNRAVIIDSVNFFGDCRILIQKFVLIFLLSAQNDTIFS